MPAVRAPPRRNFQWRIENRIRWVRDVALGEDASRLRKGSPPRLFPAFGNLAVSIQRLLKGPSVQCCMNPLHLNPNRAAALLLG